jgi:hypothetical protein
MTSCWHPLCDPEHTTTGWCSGCVFASTNERYVDSVVGGCGGGGTPGPIPNPEAKPSSADGTAPARVWESRSPPTVNLKRGLPSGSPRFFVPFSPGSECGRWADRRRHHRIAGEATTADGGGDVRAPCSTWSSRWMPPYAQSMRTAGTGGWRSQRWCGSRSGPSLRGQTRGCGGGSSDCPGRLSRRGSVRAVNCCRAPRPVPAAELRGR